MGKIILLVLGLLLVYWILKSYRRRVDRAGEPQKPAAAGENMVQCEQCGVHLPRSESLTTQGRYFCSTDHQQKHQAGRDPG